MENQAATTQNTSHDTLFVKMALSAWNSYNERLNKLVETLSDEQFLEETSSGRNRGVYLLGHLTAVSDGMMVILGFGEKLYPQLYDIYEKNPDRSALETPSVSELRDYWKQVSTRLDDSMKKLQPAEWFARHTAVSEEDFAKEPHRNKLNVVMNRTSHMSYHLGQLIYLSKK